MTIGGLSEGASAGALQRARILGIVDKQAIILVRGRAVGVNITQSKGLQEGQHLQGHLTKLASGEYRFDIKSVTDVKATDAGRFHLGAFLETHGIRPSELNFLAGYKALQMNQSLTPEFFQQISRFASMLPDLSEASIQSLILAISSRFPINKSTLKLAKEGLSSDRGIVSLLKGVLGLSKNGELSESQQGFLRQYFPDFSRRGFDLRRFFEHGGIDLESQLLRNHIPTQPQLLSEDLESLDSIRKLLKSLMSFQKLFRTDNDPSEQIIQIPYLMEGRLEELTVVLGREQGDDDDELSKVNSISMYLELSSLGPIMLKISKFEAGFKLLIKSEDFKVVDFLRSKELELSGVLGEMKGVSFVDVKITKSVVEAPDPAFLKSEVRPQKIDLSV